MIVQQDILFIILSDRGEWERDEGEWGGGMRRDREREREGERERGKREREGEQERERERERVRERRERGGGEGGEGGGEGIRKGKLSLSQFCQYVPVEGSLDTHCNHQLTADILYLLQTQRSEPS